MNQNKQLTIMEFSRLTGIKRENLRFYDRIGLLSPEKRGENNYRYYSRRQLGEAYLIASLRGLGVSIEDIKVFTCKGTQQNLLTLFTQQEARIQAEIRSLQETSLLMQIHADMVGEALFRGKNALFLEEKKEEEAIFLCPPIPTHMDDDSGMIYSYDYAEANGINLGFPPGTLIAKECLEAKETPLGYSYYFKVGNSSGGNAYKPAGLYAVIYGHCAQWNGQCLYAQVLHFIKEQGLLICGNVYEEYPIGDSATQSREKYDIKLEIPVMKIPLE